MYIYFSASIWHTRSRLKKKKPWTLKTHRFRYADILFWSVCLWGSVCDTSFYVNVAFDIFISILVVFKYLYAREFKAIFLFHTVGLFPLEHGMYTLHTLFRTFTFLTECVLRLRRSFLPNMLPAMRRSFEISFLSLC